MENVTGFYFDDGLVPEKSKNVTAVAIFLIIAILVLVSNVLVLLVLHKGRSQFDEVMVILLQILALSDLVGGVIASFLMSALQLMEVTPVSRAFCRATPPMTNFMVLQSLYVVSLVNVFRYLSITRPLWYMRMVTVTRVRVVVIIVKICILLNAFVLLPIEGFPFKELFDHTCIDSLDLLQRRPSNDRPMLLSHVTAALINVSVSFLFPLCLLTFVNARLLFIACRVGHRMDEQAGAVHRRNTKITYGSPACTHKECRRKMGRCCRRGLKGFLTVFALTGSFYVSCLPFVSVSILSVLTPDMGHFMYENGWILTVMLLISNSWWNAPVLLLTCKTFRKKAFEILPCKRSRRNLSFQESEPSSLSYLSKHAKLRPDTSRSVENPKDRADHVASSETPTLPFSAGDLPL